MQFAAIRALVETDLTATNRLISQSLNSSIPLIQELGQHIMQSGGKRMRPLLVLLGAHIFNYVGQDHIKLAAIIELIHTATLLHDDVIDTSELRRGRQTANAIWGNEASVLVGDYLYSRAFQMMVSLDNMEVMSILASATSTIVEGEILQLINCGDPDTTEERYLEVIKHKTGTLFEVAAMLGAVLCKRSEMEIFSMANYGMQLGIAFQLVDDALDYSGATAEIGKNKGDDLAEGKPTLPLIHTLKHGTTQQRSLIREAIVKSSRDNIESIQLAIESTQAIEYTYSAAEQQANLAIQHLQQIPASQYRNALLALAKFAVERKA